MMIPRIDTNEILRKKEIIASSNLLTSTLSKVYEAGSSDETLTTFFVVPKNANVDYLALSNEFCRLGFGGIFGDTVEVLPYAPLEFGDGILIWSE